MFFSSCFPSREVIFPDQDVSNISMYSYLTEGCKLVRNLGYEVAESNVQNFGILTDDEFERMVEEYPDGSLGLWACNGFLGGINTIIGIDDEERERIYSYVEKVIYRMDKVGVKYVVFGSGYARRLREGFEETDAAYIEDFLRHVNKCCEGKQITCVVEPLNKSETNWGNSVAECAKIVRKLNLPKIKLLADCYHMARENEPMSVIDENIDIILHCHIAAEDRTIPGNTEYEKRFLESLKKNGYKGAVSVECGQPDYKNDASKIIEFMKKTVG